MKDNMEEDAKAEENNVERLKKENRAGNPE